VKRERVVVLLSGGLDSAVLAYYVKKVLKLQPKLLFIDYGQRHILEYEAAKRIAKSLRLSLYYEKKDVNYLRGKPIGKDLSAVHPYRNLFLLTLAAMYAYKFGAHKIFHGASYTDYVNFPDCRPKFFKLTSSVLTQSLFNWGVVVEAPFLKFKKVDIIRLGYRLKVPFKKTVSCYNVKMSASGNLVSCGKCPACLARQKGFEELEKRR